MKRREFIALLGSAAIAWPRDACGELPNDLPLIGYFAGGRESVVADLVNAFRIGLLDLGYQEGHNVKIVYRFAEGRVERLPVLAEEIVGLNPAVILTGAVDTAVAIKKQTATIPIVSPALADAVHLGLVLSNARPSGNVTGITPYIEGLPKKQLELAREVVPGARKVGLLGNMNDPKAVPQRDELQDAGRELGVEVVVPEIRSREDIDRAMQALASERT